MRLTFGLARNLAIFAAILGGCENSQTKTKESGSRQGSDVSFGLDDPSPTPSPTSTETPSPTPDPSGSITPTATPTGSVSASPSITTSLTPTATPEPSASPTDSPETVYIPDIDPPNFPDPPVVDGELPPMATAAPDSESNIPSGTTVGTDIDWSVMDPRYFQPFDYEDPNSPIATDPCSVLGCPAPGVDL